MMKVIFTFCNHFFSASEMNDNWSPGNMKKKKKKKIFFFLLTNPFFFSKFKFLDLNFFKVYLLVEITFFYFEF